MLVVDASLGVGHVQALVGWNESRGSRAPETASLFLSGLPLGLLVSIGAFLWRSSRPHTAIVGRLAGTEHFRNLERHAVETWPELPEEMRRLCDTHHAQG